MTDPETIRYWERVRQEMKLLRLMMAKAVEPWPGPPFLKASATIDALDRIFDDKEKAMAFSGAIATAFDKAGIQLNEDETFACMLCVVKKPKYLSEVMRPTPEPSVQDPTPEPAVTPKMAADSSVTDFPVGELKASAWRAVRYHKIMEPTIMERVMDRKAQDRIDY